MYHVDRPMYVPCGQPLPPLLLPDPDPTTRQPRTPAHVLCSLFPILITCYSSTHTILLTPHLAGHDVLFFYRFNAELHIGFLAYHVL